jgi:Dolichyl-phosphate-mannose-protein mannosyltransferase
MPATTSTNLKDASAHEQQYRLRGASSSDLSERAISIAIFVSCLAYLCVFLRYSTIEPDEGIVLQGAERILRGEVPYRDFFSFYTPGSFYLIAFLFKIFGDSFAVARVSLAGAGAICSLVTYLLARRTCSRGISIFTASLATVCGTAFRFLVLHNIYSTLLCSLTLYAAVRWLETEKPLWAWITGSFASLTFLFEQSKGAGLCGGLLLAFFILGVFGRHRLFNKVRFAALTTGFVWPMLCTFAYFGEKRTATVMIESWLWPLHHYTQANRVPYDFQNWSDNARQIIFHSGPMWIRVVKIIAVSPGLLIPVLPLVAVAMLVVWTIRVRRDSDGSSSDAGYYVLVCTTVSGLLASVVLVRADVLHFMYLTPLWYVVLAWILGSVRVPGRALPVVRPYLLAYVGAAFGLLGVALLFTATGARNRIQTRRGMITTAERDTVIDYVQSHVSPDAQLLVYPYLPLYNYLTATRGPSRFDYFQPGMNTPAQAQEIIASLKSHSESAVLFEPWFAEKIANSWPDTPLAAIASDPIADYISRNYRVCKMLSSPDGWRFHFMVRKDVTCPQ